ncbi:DUF2333 family protein [Thermodesulforhabdus norvegica]|uniref:DUF2333 family protein n=1 Tax=Thermodesulforhabdus norvegica TaxID=39841 RepID=A0A1I4QRL9_9BACT|nr:DUF2333 family protein [Thermodesulforhabdus norvegica]SFM42677.1 hypothetical protein SAMN05660836_00187 [Thermodesulforhabdus norvegica]
MNKKVFFAILLSFLTITGGIVYALQRHTLLPPEEQGRMLERIETMHGADEAQKGHAGDSATMHQETGQETVKPRGQALRRPGLPEATVPPIEGRGREVTEGHRLKTFTPTVPAPPRVPETHVTEEVRKPEGAITEKRETPAEVEIPAHEEEEEHVVLPEISPIPGVTFVETMIRLMEHELDGRFLGWRPNDLIIGRFTDNINNFQLGVLEAMRFTTLRLKDSLTRMGEADAYDRDLEDALNLFMNKATQFWFPSAESQYKEAVEHLKKFLRKLHTGERRFYYRTDNLLALVVSYSDLLGNVNRTLIMDRHADGRPVSWFETDDYFYYAKGVAHVMYEILKVVRVGFYEQLVTIDAVEIMDEILHELHRAEQMDPWIILDADLDGLFANHRANLNAPLSEAAHLMTIMSRF